MSGNGQPVDSVADGQILHWPARVLASADLRGRLNGQREVILVPRAVVTPLAAEVLRANGVRVSRQQAVPLPAAAVSWGVAQERPYPLVSSAMQALARDGLSFPELATQSSDSPCRWARTVAECVARGECQGGVIFCLDPG